MKTIIDIIKILVATIAATIVGAVLVAYDASDVTVIVTFFCVYVGVTLALGVFNEPDKAHYDTIRHKGINLKKAA